MKIKILWMGITGRTGVQAEMLAKNSEHIEIVAGVCNNKRDGYYDFSELDKIKEDFDIIVDFSHKDVFDKVLEFALRYKKTLISGTSGLQSEQLEKLNKASFEIPVFRGGNFRFEIEKFINDIVEYSKTHNNLTLVETHYKSKKVPSETAKVIQKKVLETTGKHVEIISKLEYDEYINDWKLDDYHARIEKEPYKTLAKDIFKIADLMLNKKPAGMYDLSKLLMEDSIKSVIIKETKKQKDLIDFYISRGIEFDDTKMYFHDPLFSYVAEIDGAFVGSITICKEQDAFVLDEVAVVENRQGMGICKLLVSRAIERILNEFGDNDLFLVAKNFKVFLGMGFEVVARDNAPKFSECFNCSDFEKTCFPKIMKKSLKKKDLL